MSAQMLLSFLYFASLMSEVVNPSVPPPPGQHVGPTNVPVGFDSEVEVDDQHKSNPGDMHV